MFGVKEPIPGGLRPSVVYKFACTGCNACYVSETSWHFSTRVRESIYPVIGLSNFQNLQNPQHCRTLCSADCFHVLDYNSSSFQDKRGISYSQRTTLFESTITTCKSKTILMILTLSRFTSICCHIIINSTSNALYISQLKMT